MASKLSACKKLKRRKDPKKVRLEYDFAGIKAGQMMYVGTPMIVDAYVRSIPSGETRTMRAMRNMLARKNHCDATCPVSSAIFVRMVAEAALEELAEGIQESEVAPFWRIVEPDSKIAKRLNVDDEWLATKLASEQQN